METGRNVMHYALGDNQDYEHEWSKAVLEYLENGYSSEDGKSEVEVGNTTYKILKREKVTAFYVAYLSIRMTMEAHGGNSDCLRMSLTRNRWRVTRANQSSLHMMLEKWIRRMSAESR